MMYKLRAAGFDCDNDYPGVEKPSYDIVGALKLSCSHGESDEEIDLVTFPTKKAHDRTISFSDDPSSTHFTDHWGVSASDPADLAKIVGILESATPAPSTEVPNPTSASPSDSVKHARFGQPATITYRDDTDGNAQLEITVTKPKVFTGNDSTGSSPGKNAYLSEVTVRVKTGSIELAVQEMFVAHSEAGDSYEADQLYVQDALPGDNLRAGDVRRGYVQFRVTRDPISEVDFIEPYADPLAIWG